MSETRTIVKKSLSRETMEGAGVRLHRAFGYNEIPDFDPFLMLDDFRADRPKDYLAGFPWHPHRGIETVTYMLEGTVEHGDSMGHAGNVDAGEVQWMTAGSGIIHQEMPKPVDGRMGGFQLWVNLLRKHKMIDPRYQEIEADEIPGVTLPGGASVRVICGKVAGVAGPVRDIVADPEYLDVSLEPDAQFSHPVKSGYMAAVYVIGGNGRFDEHLQEDLVNRTMALFGNEGDAIGVRAGGEGVRFLFFSGKPLREPIAWGGPIVMNTQEELQQAFNEYENDTFIKKTS
jgi:redox-sensitive bicupin YhaK (pirin superfamily)